MFRQCSSLLIAILAIGLGGSRSSAADDANLFKYPQLVIDSNGLGGEPIRSVEISDDGRWLVAASGKVVCVYDLAQKSLAHTLRGYQEPGSYHIGRINAARLTRDGEFLVVGVSDQSRLGSTRVYQFSNLDEIHQLVPAHTGCTKKVSVSPSGDLVATTGCDKSIFFLKRDEKSDKWFTHKKLVKQELNKANVPSVKKMPVYFGFLENDHWLLFHQPFLEKTLLLDTRLFSSYSKLATWPPVYENKILQLGSATMPFSGQQHKITAVDLSPGGEYAFALSGEARDNLGGTIYWAALWKLGEAKPAIIFDKLRDRPSAISYNSHAGLVAIGDDFGEVIVWEADNGRILAGPLGAKKKLYRVSWSENGKRLRFADTHYSPAEGHDFNRFGPISKSFDLSSRAILPASPVPDDEVAPTIQHNGLWKLVASAKDGLSRLRIERSGVQHRVGRKTLNSSLPALNRIDRDHFGRPWSFKFLHPNLQVGSPPQFIVGTDSGVVEQFSLEKDGRNGELIMSRQRSFVGHDSRVSSISFSSDGRFMATSCWDSTIRLWNLTKRAEVADVDFFANGVSILDVPNRSEANRAGIRKEDRIISFDGGSFFSRHRKTYKIGQRVPITVARYENERPNTITLHIHLVKAPDIVKPFMTIFFSDDDWIAYTPRGYYDTSPGGEKYLGWHVNNTRSQPASFYHVSQFRKRFYRPDVIDQILITGDEEVAIRDANSNLAGSRPPSPSIDFRRPEQFGRFRPPKLTITQPLTGAKTRESSVKVRVEVTTSGREEVSLKMYINGRPPLTIPKHTISRGTNLFEQEVPLVVGKNKITAEAVIRRGITSSRKQIIVTRESKNRINKNKTKPRLFVLAIGISKYKDPKFRLKFAHQDSIDFSRFVETQKGDIYRDVDVKLITDQKATVENIRAGMQWLSDNTQDRNDVAFVFLSGHGLFDSTNTWYFPSVDLDVNKLFNTAISQDEFSGWLNKRIASRVILFADTCHAGGFGGAKGVFVKHRQGINIWQGMATLALVSCLPKEQSFEKPEYKNGAFTQALLEGLSCSKCDVDADGWISLHELCAYVKGRVPNLTNNRQHPVALIVPTVSKVIVGRVGVKPKRTIEQ